VHQGQQGAYAAPVSSGFLSSTGPRLAVLLGAGLVLLAAGAALVLGARRRGRHALR
jgi:hypothetical protein